VKINGCQGGGLDGRITLGLFLKEFGKERLVRVRCSDRNDCHQIIVVDRNYLPMHECSRRHAIKAICTGRARVLDLKTWANCSEIRSIDWKGIKVIVFPTNTGPSEHTLLGHGTRGVLRRDNWRCQYCGKKATTVDHIVPRCQGGPTTWSNLAACCLSCNQFKSGRSPEQAGMKLLSIIRGPRAHLYERFERLVKEEAA